MPKLTLKLLIPILSVILIIFLAIGVVFYFKPKLAVDQVSTESSKLENIPTNLGLNFEGQKITFNEPHELIINNKSKGISKEFNLNLNDLKEGQNNLEFKGIKNYGPIIAESKNPKVVQITTDKTPPELNLVSEVPKFIQLEKEIKLKLKTEIGTKIILNEKELNQAENEETEITIPVIDGKNNNQITTKDSFGNTSKPVDIEFQALQREGWEKYQCKDVFLPINLNSLQRGYSGVDGTREISTYTRDFLNISNSGYCDKPRESGNYYSLNIAPKDTKLPCSACDDFPLSYISFTAFPESSVSTTEANLTSTKEYVTKSGITGKLNEYSIPKAKTITGESPARYSKVFKFSRNNYIYSFALSKELTSRLNASSYYQNIERDFDEFLNNFVIL